MKFKEQEQEHDKLVVDIKIDNEGIQTYENEGLIKIIKLMQEYKDQIPDFIKKLIQMMEVMFYLSKDYPDLINWGNQGEELVIFNQTEFEDKVLHVVFRHGKLESFVRQLNMYGFHKVCRNKNSINFRNKFFFKGNENNFHLIKRRKKDGQDEQQPTNKIQDNFIRLINQKHGDQFPQLPTIVQQILQFKQRNAKTMQKLRKSLDVLGRQLNERKSKSIKPTLIQIKQMISSIEDSSKKTEMTIEQLVQQMDKETNSVKKEELDHEKQPCKEKSQPQQQLAPVISHPNNSAPTISYPALHGGGGFFGPVFHPRGTILGVSSLCSFNSVTNFMS